MREERLIMRLKYTVVAALNQESLERGADVDSQHDTLKEAKGRAQYYLTDRFAETCECSKTLGYSQVINNTTGECVADYFA